MDLKTIQNSIFNALSGSQKPESAYPLIKSDEQADAATRFRAYQSGHRIRLREAIEEDFPLSTQLWSEENFLPAFEKFVEQTASPTPNINEMGRYWVQWLEKNEKIIWPHWLIPLTQFEWQLIETRYQSYSKKAPKKILLDETTNTWIEFASVVKVQSYHSAVDEIYNDKKIHLEQANVHLLIWAQNEDVFFEKLDPQMALIWIALIESQSMTEFQYKCLKFMKNEAELAVEVHKLFQFGASIDVIKMVKN